MSKTDQQANCILGTLILIYLSVLVISITGNKREWLITLLNLLSALSIIIYWAWKQMRIKQHFFELREIIVLCFELSIASIAAYLLISGSHPNTVTILQYIFFGIHFLSLVLFFIFMLTFKMKRLI